MSEKFKIEINCGIILGDDMRIICELLPELKENFEQRKCYDEYYFNGPVECDLSIERLLRLQFQYQLEVFCREIRIKVD